MNRKYLFPKITKIESKELLFYKPQEKRHNINEWSFSPIGSKIEVKGSSHSQGRINKKTFHDSRSFTIVDKNLLVVGPTKGRP